MSQSIPNRGELNIEAIDTQIRAWVKAGHQWVDIINLAKDTWPALPKDYVLASIKLVGRILQMEKPIPVQPFRDLSVIHRKRRRRIKKLEARLEANDASVSLETLYRGLLRDQEAGCHKIMAVQRQMEEDRKQIVKDEVAAEREAKIFKQVFEQRMQQQASTVQQNPQEQPKATAKPDMMKTLSLLIGFMLTIFLVRSGCSYGQTSDRQNVTARTELFCRADSPIDSAYGPAASWMRPTPNTLLRAFSPQTLPASPPESRKPADPGTVC
ncbi:MAG: hypothetical protein QM703_01400 [Gemmatales bacterium]